MLPPTSMKRLLVIILIALSCMACAKRLPPQPRTEKILTHFFERYAKKYPTTSFGQHKIKSIEVIDQTEIRKDLAAIEAYVTLGNGDVRKVFATIERRSLRWKFVSWENPEGS